MWALLAVVMAAVIGGSGGLFYEQSVIRQACERPGAGNLCGLASAPAVPFYIIIGAVVGASIATVVVVLVLGRRKA